MKIGLIGTEKGIQKKAHLFTQAYGEENLTILHSREGDENLNTAGTVEELVRLNDLVVVEAGAVQNLNLLYHTIKKGEKVFLDLDRPLSPSVIQKCKSYHEEAGNLVAFNVSPYYALERFFNENLTKHLHIHITAFNAEKDFMVQVYQYLVFGALFLECENIQALFHVMPDNDSKVRAASVNLSNVENKYLQLFLANYPNGKSHFMVYDQNQQVQGDLPETKYFHQTDILKKQLDALYNHNVKGDLNCLYSVVSIMEKLKDSAKKKGFYL